MIWKSVVWTSGRQLLSLLDISYFTDHKSIQVIDNNIVVTVYILMLLTYTYMHVHIPGGPKKWYPGINFAITSVRIHRF